MKEVFGLLLLLFVRSECWVSHKKSYVSLARAFENITKQFWKVDLQKISVINYQMDLAAVDAIVMTNIKKENLPLVFINLKSGQLFSKEIARIANEEVTLNMRPYPINDSAIMTFDSVNSFKYFVNNI